MLLSLSWLRDFTPYEGSVDELAHRLTMVGLEVEEIVKPFARLSDLIVGRVVERKIHPGADKLSLCTVDAGGSEYLNIVCGAPNVAAEQYVAVALDGTTLPGGQIIRNTQIRGVLSQGMICSEAEMELGPDSSGIMTISGNPAPGSRLDHALDLEQNVLDIGVTPNRPDCLSVFGLAREVAAIFNLPLNKPSFSLNEDASRDCPAEIKIIIDDPAGCPLYQARLISGCAIKPSPDWMRYRLLSVGVRPINNVVDITNYVMFEFGHPLHAFDYSLLEGSRIRVARAAPGSRFTTLDNEERELNEKDLLIWDGQKPVALAGVMGGANTEINENSTEVLLECAIFDPLSIRRTARRLGLHSESSFRFERGVDQAGAPFALNRAAQLMSEFGPGQVAKGVAFSEPKPHVPVSISFRRSRANSLLALNVDLDYCRQIFSSLGCEVEGEGDLLTVTAPSFRPDLTREVDLFEEIGRIFGLDRTPEHLPKVQKSLHQAEVDHKYAFEKSIKQWARGLGLQEVINYSFTGMSDLDLLNIPAQGRVKVFNPLSEDQDVLRLHLIPGILQTLRHNLGQGNNRQRLFEVARSFEQDSNSETGVRENTRLALLLYGPRHRGHWPFAEEDTDFYDLKGLTEHLLEKFARLPGKFVMFENHPYLDPCVIISLLDHNLGFLGRVRPQTARAYKARKEVWFADLDLDQLQNINFDILPVFQSLPKYPVVKRDMNVIAPLELNYALILEVVDQAGISILEDVSLVDIYYPQDKPEKKLTLRFTYRHKERTLQDHEVDQVQQELAELLTQKIPVGFP